MPAAHVPGLVEGGVHAPYLPTGGTIAPETVTSAMLAANAVTSAKIAPEAVEAADIKLEAVTNPKIQAESVTTEKIQGSAITTLKILNAAVTAAKVAKATTPVASGEENKVVLGVAGVPRLFVAAITGNAIETKFKVKHGLETQAVMVTFLSATFEQPVTMLAKSVAISLSEVEVTFTVAPGAKAVFYVVIVG
jgi:hypothetical protein